MWSSMLNSDENCNMVRFAFNEFSCPENFWALSSVQFPVASFGERESLHEYYEEKAH